MLVSALSTDGDIKDIADALEGGVIVNVEALDKETVSAMIKLKSGDLATVDVFPCSKGLAVYLKVIPKTNRKG